MTKTDLGLKFRALAPRLTPEQRLKQIYEWVKVGHIDLREFKMLVEEYARRSTDYGEWTVE